MWATVRIEHEHLSTLVRFASIFPGFQPRSYKNCTGNGPQPRSDDLQPRSDGLYLDSTRSTYINICGDSGRGSMHRTRHRLAQERWTLPERLLGAALGAPSLEGTGDGGRALGNAEATGHRGGAGERRVEASAAGMAGRGGCRPVGGPVGRRLDVADSEFAPHFWVFLGYENGYSLHFAGCDFWLAESAAVVMCPEEWSGCDHASKPTVLSIPW